MKPETLREIFFLIVGSSRRASTPNAIAKKVTSEKVGADDVTRLIDFLREQPYLKILTTNSGRIQGLAFEYGKPGSCSSYYQRTGRGITFFYIEEKIFEKIEGDGGDIRKIVATSQMLQKHAADHNMPFLDSVKSIGTQFDAIQPFLMERLNNCAS